MIIGLTGGIASGKSTVAKILKRLGAEIVDSDVIVHNLIKNNSSLKKKIIRNFGKEILDTDGNINRKKLGKIVFNSREKLKKLELLIHPLVIKELDDIIKNTDRDKILVIVVPLLVEKNLQDKFDEIWLTYAKQSTQVKRIRKRDNLTIKEAKSRIKAQLPFREKLKYADRVINCDLPLNKTEEQIKMIWSEIM